MSLARWAKLLKRRDTKWCGYATGFPTDASDPRVIETAQSLDAVLLSLNSDFADIVRHPPGQFEGIVALQVRNRPEAIPQILGRLKGYLADHPDREFYRGMLILVEAHRVRVRR